jgi:hypothetical protein
LILPWRHLPTLRRHPNGKRVLGPLTRRPAEHILEGGKALLRRAANTRGMLVARDARRGRRPRHVASRLDRGRVRPHVEEARLLPPRGRKLRRGSAHPLAERGPRALGNDAVFAVAVGQVVRSRCSGLGAEDGVPPLALSCFLGHGARHGGSVAVDRLGLVLGPAIDGMVAVI